MHQHTPGNTGAEMQPLPTIDAMARPHASRGSCAMHGGKPVYAGDAISRGSRPQGQPVKAADTPCQSPPATHETKMDKVYRLDTAGLRDKTAKGTEVALCIVAGAAIVALVAGCSHIWGILQ